MCAAQRSGGHTTHDIKRSFFLPSSVGGETETSRQFTQSIQSPPDFMPPAGRDGGMRRSSDEEAAAAGTCQAHTSPCPVDDPTTDIGISIGCPKNISKWASSLVRSVIGREISVPFTSYQGNLIQGEITVRLHGNGMEPFQAFSSLC